MKARKKATQKRAITHSNGVPSKKFSRILVLIGVVLLSVWGIHKILYFRSLRISTGLLSTFSNTSTYKKQVTTVRVGSRISLPVVESGYVNGNWLISPNKANHVAQSASPGSAGNIIVYAHNTADLFGPLRWVSVGERVYLTTSDGILHRYIVTKIAEVSPSETSLLSPTITETVTLYTCSGFLDSKRFVVRAVPEFEK